MPINDELGQRMKRYYEEIPKSRLMRRVPVAIRIDGKAFHTFTRGFERPYDRVLMNAMQRTMQYMCKNIQGCVFGYCQSDEITLILLDYFKFTTEAWFDYEIEKICSISASMATFAFNKFFLEETREFLEQNQDDASYQQYLTYSKAIDKGAMFDARCFNIPKEEVTNLIYWRQLDATRNSIQMAGQKQFSQAQLEGKTCNDIQNMLLTEKDINWNNYPTDCKRGAACIKRTVGANISAALGIAGAEYRTEWWIDQNIPIFKGEGRDYIDSLIYVGES